MNIFKRISNMIIVFLKNSINYWLFLSIFLIFIDMDIDDIEFDEYFSNDKNVLDIENIEKINLNLDGKFFFFYQYYMFEINICYRNWRYSITRISDFDLIDSKTRNFSTTNYEFREYYKNSSSCIRSMFLLFIIRRR